MRFRKGSEVEVFHSSKLLPAGSWWPAVIVRGNGHTYTVQYNQQCCSSSSNNNTDEEERVPRKALRPPPPIKGKAGKWAPDDLVEVFVHGFWKPAKVTGVAYGNEYYFVSLFGQCREVAVKKSNLRKRCAWENGKWVTIKKVNIVMFSADLSNCTAFVWYFCLVVIYVLRCTMHLLLCLLIRYCFFSFKIFNSLFIFFTSLMQTLSRLIFLLLPSCKLMNNIGTTGLLIAINKHLAEI
jgi:Agenet domain